jgi:hypothetical protein
MPWGPSNTTLRVQILADVLVTLTGVLRVSTVRGKADDQGQYGPGLIEVEVANPLGELSPTNASSSLFPGVRVGALIIVTTLNAVDGERPVFRGTVDRIREVVAPNGDVRASRVVLTAFDAFGRLAGVEGLPLPTSIRSGDTSGVRIRGLCEDYGNVNPLLINAATGTTRVQPTNRSMNLLDEIHLTADSEFGAVWVEPNGVITFEDRLALVANARSNTVQAVFGDGPGQLPITDLQVSDAAVTEVINEAAIGRVGGAIQFASDLTSSEAYGIRRYSRADLINDSDTLCAGIAQVIVAQKKDPVQRVESITFDATTSAALMTQALTRRIRDRIEVRKLMPAAAPYTLTRQAFINRIEHEITPTSWVTTFGLVSAANVPLSAPLLGSTFQLDVSQLPI